jgi:hypothetical protein
MPQCESAYYAHLARSSGRAAWFGPNRTMRCSAVHCRAFRAAVRGATLIGRHAARRAHVFLLVQPNHATRTHAPPPRDLSAPRAVSIISEAGTCAACDELMAQHEFVLMTNQTKGTCQHLECFLNKDRPVETYVSFENLTADQLERVFAIIQPFRDEIEEKEQAKVDKAQARLEKAEAIVKKKQANAEKAAAKKKGPKVRVGGTMPSRRARVTTHSKPPPAGVQEGGRARRLRHRHGGARGEEEDREEADDARASPRGEPVSPSASSRRRPLVNRTNPLRPAHPRAQVRDQVQSALHDPKGIRSRGVGCARRPGPGVNEKK